MRFLTRSFKDAAQTIERAIENASGELIDFTNTRELIDFTNTRIDYMPGSVVVPRDTTVLEQDTAFRPDGSILINLVTSSCILLVLDNNDGDLRIFALQSGEVGYVRAEAMMSWTCDP